MNVLEMWASQKATTRKCLRLKLMQFTSPLLVSMIMSKIMTVSVDRQQKARIEVGDPATKKLLSRSYISIEQH